MQRRVRWGVLAVSLLLLGALSVALLVRHKPEPLCEGKTIREWVLMLDMHVNARAEHDQAQAKLWKIGAPVVPVLESILQERPHRVLDRLKAYGIRFVLLKPEKITWPDRAQRACRAAYVIGERNTDIRRLVPHLQFHFTNGTYADSDAARALARAGKEGIAVLTNLLATGSRNVRDQSAWGLHFVARDPMAVDAWTRAIDTETDRTLRANAVGYLRHSKAPADRMVPIGLRFIRSEDGYDRWHAAQLLAQYIAVDDKAHEALEGALNDSDNRVRLTATNALRRQRPAGRSR